MTDPQRIPTPVPAQAAAPAVVPIAELARAARVSSATLISAARRGELAVTRIGRRFYTSPEIVREYLTPRRLTPETANP